MAKVLKGARPSRRLSTKESTCNVVDSLQFVRCGFCLWVRKIPWRRKWQLTPVFLPGKSHGQREPGGLQSTGSQESDTTEWLNHHHHKGSREWCKCGITEKIYISGFTQWLWLRFRHQSKRWHGFWESGPGPDPDPLSHSLPPIPSITRPQTEEVTIGHGTWVRMEAGQVPELVPGL